MELDLPPLAATDVIRNVPGPVERWREAVTVGAAGELGRAPIAGGKVPVLIPDGYLGQFEVHMIADDGTRLVVAEGRRLPPLED